MNILLLQGPLSPFFGTLADTLHAKHHTVFRIAFNGGDTAWRGAARLYHYRDKAIAWEVYLRRFLRTYQIDCVICYGDCRYYHRIASEVCKKKGIAFWVLEEGYLRPHFITAEPEGVNAFSPWYSKRHELVASQRPVQESDVTSLPHHFGRRIYYAMHYYLRRALLSYRYPDAIHHRPWSIWQEGLAWLNTGVVKLARRRADRQLLNHLLAAPGPLFLLPLQVAEDFQLRVHSNFTSIEQSIETIIRSFARHASSESRLLIKHHPMDRGYVCYRRMISRCAVRHNVLERVFYGHELPLPTLYRHLSGVVTINSTVGLSALLHKVPTLCLGRALYDVPGLTAQQGLDNFWQAPSPVCSKTFSRMRASLLQLTQVNGSFYSQLSWSCDQLLKRICPEAEMTTKRHIGSRSGREIRN